ncbi:MAG TPA: hypothetical protein VN193_11640 [Candidatus Angelobacter sp.]|nr:hypothetical protein [Candidatus Angelobacter sp.]
MSRRAMAWTSMHVGRRRFLQGGLATVFATVASVAVGRSPVGASDHCPCDGPFGGGYCGSGLCNGSNCSHSGLTFCSLTTAFCNANTGCWTCNGATCCDCACNGGGSSWYCYCGG